MTGQLPFVSILMTAFNREKLIPYAIESVLSSTYNNFELIIVDDASADATVNIAQSYASKDDRIKIYVNEKNLGDYPNRNKAASYAKGKYLKYLDSDDYIYPNGLEIMVCSMERFPDAGFGLCSLKPDAEKPYPFLLNPKESYQYHFLGPGLFHKGPLTSIFLRSAFEELRGFKEGRMVSDTDMWHRMALKYPVVLMQDGIVWQRIHGKQELADSHNFIVAGAKIKWSYLLEPDCPLTRTQVKLIRRRRLKRYAGFVVSGLKHFNFKQAGTYLKCLFFTLRIRV